MTITIPTTPTGAGAFEAEVSRLLTRAERFTLTAADTEHPTAALLLTLAAQADRGLAALHLANAAATDCDDALCTYCDWHAATVRDCYLAIMADLDDALAKAARTCEHAELNDDGDCLECGAEWPRPEDRVTRCDTCGTPASPLQAGTTCARCVAREEGEEARHCAP